MNEYYFKILYKLVKKSYYLNEIPVAAIIIRDNKIIGKGYNNRQTKKNICGHAEINAILKAERKNKDWRLSDCIMLTTLKPCKMCGEIIKSSRIEKIYYIMDQSNACDLNNLEIINEKNHYIEEINVLFKNFFKKLR